jgi:myo-inositol-1(or 4)-monophosphatase
MEAAGALGTDWLGFSRRATRRARTAIEAYRRPSERARYLGGRGEGGDMTLAIDGAAEDAVFAELDELGVGLRALSEERGLVEVLGGGRALLVIDPIDGSLNAKRDLAPFGISIAVADGEGMGSVRFGYVADFASGEEWWALSGAGAFRGGERLGAARADAWLEILGVESADPDLVAAGADALAASGAHRLRMIGSIALSLCYVASCRFDGLISLRGARSVDAAAGQLIVREAGGSIAFPDVEGDASLDLTMRSRVLAAPTTALLEELLELSGKVQA